MLKLGLLDKSSKNGTPQNQKILTGQDLLVFDVGVYVDIYITQEDEATCQKLDVNPCEPDSEESESSDESMDLEVEETRAWDQKKKNSLRVATNGLKGSMF